jgi:hypothetical protein
LSVEDDQRREQSRKIMIRLLKRKPFEAVVRVSHWNNVYCVLMTDSEPMVNGAGCESELRTERTER